MHGFNNILLTQQFVADYYSPLDVKIYTFERYGCDKPMPFSVRETINYATAIADIVKREKIDCILGISYTGTFYASASRDIFRFHAPVIGNFLGNISAYFKSEKRRPKLLERMLLWYLLRRPYVVVVSSEGVKDDLITNFGVAGERILRIYNGVDIKDICHKAAEMANIGGKYDGKIIATACRLNAQKDFQTLLRAFKLVRENMEAKLLIIGDGEMKQEIIKLAHDLDVDADIIITGFQRNPFKFMKKADVFVLSSFFEGFSNVIVEAMALGIPVVSTDCPSGPSEIIQHGVNGFLVPVQDYCAMTNAIMSILRERELRDVLSLRGRERAENFTAEKMVENFRLLISNVCCK